VGVVAVIAVAVLISQSVPGAVFVLGLFMVAPGFALVRLLGLRDLALEGILSVALSLALAGILSTIQAYVGAWSPAATTGLLLAITIGALVARPLLALARRVQPRLASRVSSTGAISRPARSPVELVATPGVPAMRPRAAPLLTKIATTRYGDGAGAVRPVGVMAPSTAGAPAPTIGQPPARAFELAPRAETAPGVGFELKPSVEPTLRLPFELPRAEPVAAEADEDLPAWARRPVGEPSATVPPPSVVEVTPRAVVSTRRAAPVPVAGGGKTRPKATRARAEASKAIAGTPGGRVRKPAPKATEATPVATPVASPRKKAPAVVDVASVPPARKRSRPGAQATPPAESASTRASAVPVRTKAPARPVPPTVAATTRRNEPAAPQSPVVAASAREREPAKPVATSPVAAPVRSKPARPAMPTPVATATVATATARKKAPRTADVSLRATAVVAPPQKKSPAAASAKATRVDPPIEVADVDVRKKKPRLDAAPRPLEAATVAPEPIRKTTRREAAPLPAPGPAAAAAPVRKKPPRVAQAAAVAAPPVPSPVIHRRPRPAGGETGTSPRRRGTLADDALAESGATRTFRSAIEHVIDDLADQRDRTKK
jgi:hypothetical protein